MLKFSSFSIAGATKIGAIHSITASTLCAAAVAIFFAGALPALSANAPLTDKTVENQTQTIDPVCAQADIKLLTTIEMYEDDVLNASPVLIDAVRLLELARVACADGDVAAARTVYESAIRQVEVAAREGNATTPYLSRR